MLLGQPTKLQSQFRLTYKSVLHPYALTGDLSKLTPLTLTLQLYSMILNLLRVEALRVEEMIKRSFSENAQQRLLPDQQKKIMESERELRALEMSDASGTNDKIREYHEEASRLTEVNHRVIQSILSHPSGSKALQAGRVVILRDGVSIPATDSIRLWSTYLIQNYLAFSR